MKIIVNPKAGRGSSDFHLKRLEAAVSRSRKDVELVFTNHPGHARELAKQAAENGDEIVAVMGGDGTIAEAANGVVGAETALGVIAVGTGNDFARSLGLPRNDPSRSFEVLERGRRCKVDVGVENKRYFISILGVGFPADVVREANSNWRWRGSIAFFLAVYTALHKMRSTPISISLDGRTQELECTSVMIQNTPYTGGGLLMAPQARMDDGMLDVVIVTDIKRLDLMVNFPRVYRGTHLTHPKFSLMRCQTIEITSETPLAKVYDGDLEGQTPLCAQVIPRALTVLI